MKSFTRQRSSARHMQLHRIISVFVYQPRRWSRRLQAVDTNTCIKRNISASKFSRGEFLTRRVNETSIRTEDLRRSKRVAKLKFKNTNMHVKAYKALIETSLSSILRTGCG